MMTPDYFETMKTITANHVKRIEQLSHWVEWDNEPIRGLSRAACGQLIEYPRDFAMNPTCQVCASEKARKDALEF